MSAMFLMIGSNIIYILGCVFLVEKTVKVTRKVMNWRNKLRNS